MTVKRVYFFSLTDYQRFDVAADTVPAGYPRPVTAWTGLPATISGAVNWNNGKVYFFDQGSYYRWDVLRNTTDPGYPKPVAGSWAGFAGTGFETGFDAAVNWGNGKVYFFKGTQYLRFDVAGSTVDAGYPKPIAGNWPGVAGTIFERDIDAAINWGNDKVYWFHGDQYGRIDGPTKTLDPGYPKPVAGNWSGVFGPPISTAVEWPTAIVAAGGFNVPTNRSGCQVTGAGGGNNKGGEAFDMDIDFDTTPYANTCAVGEYRQYVRGSFTVNGSPLTHLLADPGGGPPPLMLPTPAPGAAGDNFRQDGAALPAPTGNIFYGHRNDTLGNTFTNNIFQPDRFTGCQYRGKDYPGIMAPPGTTYVVQLDFRGQAVDAANGDDVLQSNDWNVNCSGTL